jgi:hypothetical protein
VMEFTAQGCLHLVNRCSDPPNPVRQIVVTGIEELGR